MREKVQDCYIGLSFDRNSPKVKATFKFKHFVSDQVLMDMVASPAIDDSSIADFILKLEADLKRDSDKTAILALRANQDVMSSRECQFSIGFK